MRVYSTYEHLLNDDGEGNAVDPDRPMLARELARMDLTLNYYTQWYWKVDLHNLLHFLSLRIDAHAQHEIRVYAEIMADLTRKWVPVAWEAFEDYRLGAMHFSREEVALLKAALDPERVDELLPASGLSMREKREFRDKMGVPAKKRSDGV